MGKGRAPCCDKSQVKRGPWSPAEDLRLISFIQKHGHENWRALPKQAGLLRCGKSCRLRWINYLRPDVKRGNFTPEEEETIIKLHESLGNKWSRIASHLPGRTDNEIKNVWNTHLKKRLVSKVAESHGDIPNEFSMTSPSSSSSSSSCKSYDKDNVGISPGDQIGRDSVTKNPRKVCKMGLQDSVPVLLSNQTSSNNQRKEPSSSSSVSYNSNISNSSQTDLTGPEELIGSVVSSRGDCEVQNTLQEMHKLEMPDEVLELPLESDSEFWNMLDSFSPLKSNEAQDSVVGVCQSSKFGEEYNSEVESRKWLRYLENELGLEAIKDENQGELTMVAAEPLVPKAFHDDALMVKKEIEQGMAHFQSWPSSPQNFAI